ncbi:trypsin-like peptidase domain-containing protein [Leptolyngbya sp. FACHB-261]|uniref:trypsin-like peptidase domain-containing protein n=1 Tax=Leptolyngbya sp. FACHB-261 TaxID=2692806 RepID=UPI001686F817|nr:trypsin-like peptidase domain-containing protein [Leptolyngbya sp. FACHB-261]MBD2103843.1 trypsin-like peptidase domain-containing protein [Leptolyngbya sp. FACHB-261]
MPTRIPIDAHCCAVCLLLLLASCSGSQTASTLALPRNQPQEFTGELSSSDASLEADGSPYDPIEFSARAGERLDVTLSSDQFDPYLTLLGPNGDEIAADDDSGSENNARLSVILVKDGQYRLLCNSFSATAKGKYHVGLTLRAAEPSVQPLQPQSADFKGDLSLQDGLLSSGQLFDAYAFNGRRGQLLEASLRAGKLDTYLRLVGPDGNVLAENDDFSKRNAGSLLAAELPKTGPYTLLVSTLEPIAQGSYHLQVRGVKALKALGSNSVNLLDRKGLRVFDFDSALTRFFEEPIAVGTLPYLFKATVQIVTAKGTGSGTLVTPKGLILTNFHVVQAATSQKPIDEPVIVSVVQRVDEPVMPLFQAQVLRYDADTDLALLQITSDLRGHPLPASFRLPTLPLGNAEAVQLGDGVRILGFPGTTSLVNGSSYLSFTQGAISSIIRGSNGKRYDFLSDAVVNSGNSGGAAINAQGELIGIPSENLFLADHAANSDLDKTSVIRAVSALPPEWQALLQAKPIGIRP